MTVLYLTRGPATRVVTVERTQLVTPSASAGPVAQQRRREGRLRGAEQVEGRRSTPR